MKTKLFIFIFSMLFLTNCVTTQTSHVSISNIDNHQFTIENTKLVWKHTFSGNTSLISGSFSGLIPDNIGKLKWQYALPAYISTGVFSGDYQVIKNDSTYTVLVKNLKVVSQTLLMGSTSYTRDVSDIVITNGEFKSGMGFPQSLVILHDTFINKFNNK